MKALQLLVLLLGGVSISLHLSACAAAKGDPLDGTTAAPTTPMPQPSSAIEADLIGIWEGRQPGNTTTEAIVTFKPGGTMYTFLKTGSEYTALATPEQYQIRSDRTPTEIDVQFPQTSQLGRWGILEFLPDNQTRPVASSTTSMGNGTVDAPLSPLSQPPRDRLRISLVNTDTPRPRTFEPNRTTNLTRRPARAFNPSANISRQGQLLLEALVKQQLANYIEEGQFSELGIQSLNSIAPSYNTSDSFLRERTFR